MHVVDQLRELEADGFVEPRVYTPGHQAIGAEPLKVRLTVPSPAMLTTTSSWGAGHCVWTRLPVRTICTARTAFPRPTRLLASHAKALWECPITSAPTPRAASTPLINVRPVSC